MAKTLSVKDSSLTAVADSIRKKTGKTNKLNFPAEFVSEIESITTGGGGSTPAVEVQPSDVNFFDYDGTLIASYTEAEAKAITKLPEPPAHSGLVFQGWNYTLEEVIANADAADVGALYITDDGATRIYIELPNNERTLFKIEFNFLKHIAGTVIDWGDHESETISDINMYALSASHTYKSAGTYVIAIHLADGESIKLGHGSCIVQDGLTNSYQHDIYTDAVKKIEIGKNVFLSKYCFQELRSLKTISITKDMNFDVDYGFSSCGIEYITIPQGATKINMNFFENCNNLAAVSIPPSVIKIYKNAFYYAALRRICIPKNADLIALYSLSRDAINSLSIPAGITKINSYSMYCCNLLCNVELLGQITAIDDYAFSGCKSLKTVDFTHCTAVPTLKSASAFSDCASDLQILVPAALVDEWKAATNWTVHADKIVGV